LGSGKSVKNGNDALQSLRRSLEQEVKAGVSQHRNPADSGQSASNKSFKDFLLQNKE